MKYWQKRNDRFDSAALDRAGPVDQTGAQRNAGKLPQSVEKKPIEEQADAMLASELLTTPEAARYVRLSGRTLERYRVDGGGPEYLKLGCQKRSRVYYLTSALREWVLKNKHTSTSEYRDRKPG